MDTAHIFDRLLLLTNLKTLMLLYHQGKGRNESFRLVYGSITVKFWRQNWLLGFYNPQSYFLKLANIPNYVQIMIFSRFFVRLRTTCCGYLCNHMHHRAANRQGESCLPLKLPEASFLQYNLRCHK
jgi:hypothetical protein